MDMRGRHGDATREPMSGGISERCQRLGVSRGTKKKVGDVEEGGSVSKSGGSPVSAARYGTAVQNARPDARNTFDGRVEICSLVVSHPWPSSWRRLLET